MEFLKQFSENPTLGMAQPSTPSSIPPTRPTQKCQEHGEDLKVICLTCPDTPVICHLCVVDTHPNPSHTTKSLIAYSKILRQKLDPTLDLFDKAFQTSEDVVQKLFHNTATANREQANVIRKHFTELSSELNRQKQAMLRQVENSLLENNKRLGEWSRARQDVVNVVEEFRAIPVGNCEDIQKAIDKIPSLSQKFSEKSQVSFTAVECFSKKENLAKALKEVFSMKVSQQTTPKLADFQSPPPSAATSPATLLPDSTSPSLQTIKPQSPTMTDPQPVPVIATGGGSSLEPSSAPAQPPLESPKPSVPPARNGSKDSLSAKTPSSQSAPRLLTTLQPVATPPTTPYILELPKPSVTQQVPAAGNGSGSSQGPSPSFNIPNIFQPATVIQTSGQKQPDSAPPPPPASSKPQSSFVFVPPAVSSLSEKGPASTFANLPKFEFKFEAPAVSTKPHSAPGPIRKTHIRTHGVLPGSDLPPAGSSSSEKQHMAVQEKMGALSFVVPKIAEDGTPSPASNSTPTSVPTFHFGPSSGWSFEFKHTTVPEPAKPPPTQSSLVPSQQAFPAASSLTPFPIGSNISSSQSISSQNSDEASNNSSDEGQD